MPRVDESKLTLEQKKIVNMTRKISGLLDKSYSISIKFTKPEHVRGNKGEEALAAVGVDSDNQWIIVYFWDTYNKVDDPEHDVMSLVIHELLHVILMPLWDVCSEIIDNNLNEEGPKNTLCNLYSSREEHIVRNLTKIILHSDIDAAIGEMESKITEVIIDGEEKKKADANKTRNRGGRGTSKTGRKGKNSSKRSR
jgi:hypothetical protein